MISVAGDFLVGIRQSISRFESPYHALFAATEEVNQMVDRFAVGDLCRGLLQGVLQQQLRGHEDDLIGLIQFL